MSNFKITFENPWFMLLLIPALALTLIPYFRLAKRYRRTRNRIISMILHMIVMFLSVSVLSGMAFTYTVPNPKSEIILLVDYSHSNRASLHKKEQYIESILSLPNLKEEEFHIGIVTFGRDQVYAAELSTNYEKVIMDYKYAPKPDDSATDFVAALEFAASKFTNTKESTAEHTTAKIVLLTDGIETDGSISKNSTVLKLLAQGIRIDTVYFPDEYDPEARIASIIQPEDNIIVGKEIEIGVVIQSNYEGPATLKLYDFNVEQSSTQILMKKGIDTYNVKHTFLLPGAHEISVVLEPISKDDNSSIDTLTQNNTYYSYFYIEVFDRILIVEGQVGVASRVKELLGAQELNYNINVVNIKDVPKTLKELREYDQVILMDVDRHDMPGPLRIGEQWKREKKEEPWRTQPSPGWENSAYTFEELLYSYVKDYGGGLFTVGGDNAFKRDSMVNSKYQDLLPVEAEDYKPPLALMIIIDCSGSMSAPQLDAAKQGSRDCIDALSYRDFIGIIRLEDKYAVELQLTAIPQKQKAINAINNLKSGGGTIYEASFVAAESALGNQDAYYKHVIFISDGAPGDSKERYLPVVQRMVSKGITMSTICVDKSVNSKNVMEEIAQTGKGVFYNCGNDLEAISRSMRHDVRREAITMYNPETFTPVISKFGGPVEGITQDDMPELDGFYGTKLKQPSQTRKLYDDVELNDPDVYLVSKYAPIYAQWKYGKGKVGAFMCDLHGHWSDKFLNDDYGQLFIKNVVKGLFPNENIRDRDIALSFETNNYTTVVSYYTSSQLSDGEYIEISVTAPNSSQPQIFRPNLDEADNRITYSYSSPGFYEFTAVKKDANGKEISKITKTTTFSYSEEYNTFIDAEAVRLFLADIATLGGGTFIEDIIENNILIPKSPEPVFKGIAKDLPRFINPAMPFIIIALILFLLDIAVRKFKFKWPWEIIRDSKAKKQLKGSATINA